MFTYDEIMKMSGKELKENWTEVACSAYKLIGATDMDDADIDKIIQTAKEEPV